MLSLLLALVPQERLSFDQTRFAAMEWRCIGPVRGGRCAAVAGHPTRRGVFYMGSAGGGVWRTDDGGISWHNVSDGYFGGSIGAVEVSRSDPNVIYVGGGESTVRGNVSHGDGVWKSTDGGRTWRQTGLEDSRHIARLRVHPRDPDLVYAAVLGHVFGPHPVRGVYRSRDGGRTWRRILFVNEHTGAVDLALDPRNPRIVYASLWRVRRTPWSLESGGVGSSLWKSTDGGDTWRELTSAKGMPEGPIGIIGVAPSPAREGRVWAIVEAREGGVFRSDDGGETWARVNSDRSLRQRAWYYTRIYADPRLENRVYVLNVRLWRSDDGGKTFTTIRAPHGDHHDLWIDPGDPDRMIEGNDGGANVSFDGGRSWSRQDNQPTGQFYRVSTDRAFPYRVLGAQQDNSAVRIRSRGFRGGSIGLRDWEPTAGGESGHIVADPRDPDVVYGGSYGGYLARVNHRTGERRTITVWPDNPMGHAAGDLKYRFQWNFPILFSPHDPGTLYAAANVLFVTRDEGQSWQAISPDLTRNDPDKLGPSGGPITKDNTGVEYYCTIFAVAESPLEKGVIWTGSDDGLIHVTRDGGKTWTDVTPPSMPEWILVNSIEADPFEPGGLYVAATMYKHDDFRPYLYRTKDYGRTWARIVSGIERDHFTRVLRADPVRRGLLFAGTERGVYVSFDDGARWRRLQLDLPITPITDLAIAEGDLIAATQGRAMWILDDLSPLRQVTPEILTKAVHLFTPRDAWRLGGARRWRGSKGVGAAPPAAVVDFWLAEIPKKKVRLEFRDATDRLVRVFSTRPRPGEGRLRLRRGLNRFVWDLRHRGAKTVPGMILWGGGTGGPLTVPGAHRVRLDVGGEVHEARLRVRKDPRSAASLEDLRAQLAFLLEVRDELSRTHRAILRLRSVREQLSELLDRPEVQRAEALAEAVRDLVARLTEIEEALYQTRNRAPQDPLNHPIRLNNRLSALAGVVAAGDARPTDQAVEVKKELTAAIERQLARLESLLEERIPAIETLARQAKIPFVSLRRADQAAEGPGKAAGSRVR